MAVPTRLLFFRQSMDTLLGHPSHVVRSLIETFACYKQLWNFWDSLSGMC